MSSQGYEHSDKRAAFDELFSGDRTVVPMTLRDVVEWFESDGANRLRLPPIQRSLVWRNEQIVNYWDSLLRGYPAGLMMVTQVADGLPQHGVGIDNITRPLEPGGYQLFDGQQRLSALLLGLGKGPLDESRRLWVANGRREGSSDLLFDFRINSKGQPFGYKPDAPNEKLPVDVRRKAHEAWPDDSHPDQIFMAMAQNDRVTLGASTEVMPLARLIQMLVAGRHAEVRADLLRSSFTHVDELMIRLEKALKAEVIIKLVDSAIMDGDNYARFFRRVGQGGTRLSDEELSYSLIKNRLPHVRDRMAEIVDAAGRFASEVDLILGALRIVITLEPFSGMNEWDRTRRPAPDQVGKLFDQGNEKTLEQFRELLPGAAEPSSPLRLALQSLRKGLEYNKQKNERGMPPLLLARMPRDLLDTLLLFTFRRGAFKSWTGEDRETLIAFTLHWLLFVSNDVKAASLSFLHAQASNWHFELRTIAALVYELEAEGWSRQAPREGDWCELYAEIEERGPELATWPQRFTKRDTAKPETADRRMPGDALRVWSTHDELIKRGLMWMQRRYITRRFPSYDPTSARDDDLPLDLDHLIPQSFFTGNWTTVEKRLGPDLDKDQRNSFYQGRYIVGNSVGNLRWLAGSDNRARSNGELEPECAFAADDCTDRLAWNPLISNGISAKWSAAQVREFQRLINKRTLMLIQALMDESGITTLVTRSDSREASSGFSATP